MTDLAIIAALLGCGAAACGAAVYLAKIAGVDRAVAWVGGRAGGWAVAAAVGAIVFALASFLSGGTPVGALALAAALFGGIGLMAFAPVKPSEPRPKLVITVKPQAGTKTPAKPKAA